MRVAVVGSGYVGLVTGACLASLGHRVTCIDGAAERVDSISSGRVPFFEPRLPELLSRVVAAGRLAATTDLASAVGDADVTLIAVGTPDNEGRIDLGQIEEATAQIGAALRGLDRYHVVAVKSTVVPGTTDDIVRPVLERHSGKRVGVELGLCMNPEFLREGSAVDDFERPDRIVIGAYDQRSADAFLTMYEWFDCPKPIVSLRNAEFIKYASNCFLATCISFSNEIAGLCEAIPGADVETVMDGLHLDKRLSPVVNGERVRPGILHYLRPSSGYGGSCFPKDVAAIRSFANAHDLRTPLIDAVAGVNEHRPKAVLDLAEARIGRMASRRVAVLGLSFKSGSDDLRSSPAITLVTMLLQRGADVVVYDPVAMEHATRLLGSSVVYAPDAYAAVQDADMLLIGTGWPEWRELDWDRVAATMKGRYLFDARNSLRDCPLPSSLTRLEIGRGPAEADGAMQTTDAIGRST